LEKISVYMNSTVEFNQLVSDHYQPLYRFAMSLTRAESDALDLTQHTYYIWAKKGHQVRDISKIKTWLFTTLHRAFLQARRREVRFPHHDLETVSQQLPVLNPEFVNRADCSEVLAALAKVDDIFQAAVALYYLEDCSYKEIAVILDVPIGTVKSRISRGIAQLRKLLLLDDVAGSSPSKNSSPASAPRATESSDCHYDEWDFSSTPMTEHFGVA
jgi:RNA polymerase sigma-70 factor (ECF subfamily)